MYRRNFLTHLIFSCLKSSSSHLFRVSFKCCISSEFAEPVKCLKTPYMNKFGGLLDYVVPHGYKLVGIRSKYSGNSSSRLVGLKTNTRKEHYIHLVLFLRNQTAQRWISVLEPKDPRNSTELSTSLFLLNFCKYISVNHSQRLGAVFSLFFINSCYDKL